MTSPFSRSLLVACVLGALFGGVTLSQTAFTASSLPPTDFMTVEEALQLAFGKKATVAKETVYLTKDEQARATELSGKDVTSKIVRPYVAASEKGEVLGTAYFDKHRVRTLDETLMIVVDLKGEVSRIEVLAFNEPQDYIPSTKWYDQFKSKPLDKELSLKRKIRGVTGCTLTARSTTDGVRRTLALHQVLVERKARELEKKKREEEAKKREREKAQ